MAAINRVEVTTLLDSAPAQPVMQPPRQRSDPVSLSAAGVPCGLQTSRFFTGAPTAVKSCIATRGWGPCRLPAVDSSSRCHALCGYPNQAEGYVRIDQDQGRRSPLLRLGYRRRWQAESYVLLDQYQECQSPSLQLGHQRQWQAEGYVRIDQDQESRSPLLQLSHRRRLQAEGHVRLDQYQECRSPLLQPGIQEGRCRLEQAVCTHLLKQSVPHL